MKLLSVQLHLKVGELLNILSYFVFFRSSTASRIKLTMITSKNGDSAVDGCIGEINVIDKITADIRKKMLKGAHLVFKIKYNFDLKFIKKK